ncbi:rbrA, partial [Symbiodinium microadriaticum]
MWSNSNGRCDPPPPIAAASLVRRLRGRVLAGAREGAYYGAPPGLLEQMGRKLLT